MIVIDSFLSGNYKDKLERILLSQSFPWYYHEATVSSAISISDSKVKEGPQFIHMFSYNGETSAQSFSLVAPLIYLIEEKLEINTDRLSRIKANLIIPNPTYPIDNYFTPHIDYQGNEDFNTAIYYVNDNDGDTNFFDSNANIIESVTPKKGRLVLFDGQTLHAGRPSTNSPKCLINFNFIKVKE